MHIAIGRRITHKYNCCFTAWLVTSWNYVFNFGFSSYLFPQRTRSECEFVCVAYLEHIHKAVSLCQLHLKRGRWERVCLLSIIDLIYMPHEGWRPVCWLRVPFIAYDSSHVTSTENEIPCKVMICQVICDCLYKQVTLYETIFFLIP